MTRATSAPHRQWEVPVKWVQSFTKSNKDKVQVRTSFDVFQTDAEDSPTSAESVDPDLPEFLLRNETKADGHKHPNDDCVVPATTTAMIAHVVMEVKSTCALLREESCLGVRKEEESGS